MILPHLRSQPLPQQLSEPRNLRQCYKTVSPKRDNGSPRCRRSVPLTRHSLTCRSTFYLFIFQLTLLIYIRASLDAINARATAERQLQERQLLLKEFEAGIWNVDEYREKLRELMHDKAEPVKRARYSPDWPDWD